jgi:serine/threonine protein kinase/tetratricopeptide (TPR) repeat protein
MQSESKSLSEEERQLRRACAELDRRLRGGERGVAAKLLAGDPRLSSNAEVAIELIYTECVTLEELGDRPSLDNWTQQYPQWTERLQRLWKLHEAFDEGQRETPAKSETVHGHPSTRDIPSTESLPKSKSSGPRLNHWLGQYELLEEIDRGGMGIVYRARQQGLNRIVAVKSIRADTASESDRNRFRLEAEAAARLEHPNIVRVYEVGEQDGCDYLSMEFIEGGSLQRRLKVGRLSTRLSAELLATLADAVHYAHDQGIIHRDLKPGNILVGLNWGLKSGEYPFTSHPNATVKITDFGLAKRYRENALAQTQTGAIIGTPSYMSPEQADGRQADVGVGSDIYSLGAILYELLVGRPPLEAPTAMQTLQWIRSRDPVPPHRIDPDIPRDLETICLKCLNKEPERRYATARDLADDLRCFLDHRPICARPVSIAERSWRVIRRHSLISALTAALLLVCVVSGALFVWQQQQFGQLATLAASTERVAVQQEKRATAAEAEAEARFQQARQLVEQWTRLGDQLYQGPGMDDMRRQALEQALAYYSGFLSEHEDDPQLRLATARAAIRAGVLQSELGHWEKAKENLEQAVSLFESLPAGEAVEVERLGGLLNLGHVQRRLERWADAETTYKLAIESGKRLIKQNPRNDNHAISLANALINLCVVFNHDRRWEEAEQSYGRSIHLLRATIERRLEPEAKPEANPPVPTAVAPDDMRFVPIDEIRASHELRQKLITGKPAALALLGNGNYLTELALCLDDLGGLIFRRGKIEDAEFAYTEALEFRQLTQRQRPRDAWVSGYVARSHTHLGEVAERLRRWEDSANRYQQAITLLKALHDAAPARVDYSVELGTAYAKLARIQRNQEKFAESADTYRLAIAVQEQLVATTPSVNSLKRELATSCEGLGRVLNAQGKEQEALDAYQRAVQVDETYSLAHNNLAWLLLIATDHSLRDHEKALELAQRATELDPKSRASWHTLGTARYRLGQFDDSEKSIQRSMDLMNGGTAHDWFYIAAIHASRGNVSEARNWFDRAKAWRESQAPRDGQLRMIQEEATVALAEMAESEASN